MRLPWTLHGSDVRRISDMAGESVLLAGGGRAILLQLANPGVGHGVAEHSDFVERPLSRLHGTMTYLYAIVFGSPSEVAHVRRVVGRAHRPVHDGGSSSVQLFERVHGPIDPAHAETVYQDYALVGTSLQMPRELWPADVASFRQYWDDAVERLEVDDVTRRVAHELLHPTTGPWWLRAVMPLARLVTAGSLPSGVRDDFGLPWSTGAQRRYDLVMRITAAVVPHLPPRLRHVLRDGYLRRLRSAMAADARTTARS
jgi:uncharacterized protein (DUF2236 family)